MSTPTAYPTARPSQPTPPRAPIGGLTLQLFRASVSSRTGTGTLTLLSLGSLTVGATIAFLVAGGTYMFYRRGEDANLQARLGTSQPGMDAHTWTVLALTACAFLVPALFSLISQAAVTSAAGRERRLAALRLIGLSARDISRMTVLETGINAVVGTALGALLSALLVPAFSTLTFMGIPLSPSELYLPWWGYLAVGSALIVLALAAALAGMQRVAVSPLGVARQQMPRALRWWRAVAFLVLAVALLVGVNQFEPSAGLGDMLAVAAFLLLLIGTLNLIAPLFLQVSAWAAGALGSTANFIASRRVATGARAAWRRVSPSALFGLLAGYMIVSPFGDDDLSESLRENPETSIIFHDVFTGIILTISFGFCIMAMSILQGQAHEVFANADLTRSLRLMGLRPGFLTRVATYEIFAPLITVSLLGFAWGAVIGLMMLYSAGDLEIAPRLANAGLLLGAGWLVVAVAFIAVIPLRNRVAHNATRKND